MTNTVLYDLVPADPTRLEELKVDCPKCKSEGAWYAVDRQDVTLRCLCGYNKVVATRLQETVIEHIDKEDEITLPRKGTKLWDCLAMLYALATANSQEITDGLNDAREEKLSVSEVSSQLTVLRYKGLVKTVGEERKGFIGGSTWELTAVARRTFAGGS